MNYIKIIMIAGLCFFYNAIAQDELRIDITQGRIDPYPIAIPAFLGSSSNSLSYGRAIAQVVNDNLLSTKLFELIDKKAYIEKFTDINTAPHFASWRNLNAKILLQASIGDVVGGRIELQFRLWDVARGQSLVSSTLSIEEPHWRRLGHLLADVIYERLTGDEGYFDTRIVYIAESGSYKRKIKRLAIMDQDGKNHKYLTDGSNLVLTPRFSPDSQQIAYLGYPKQGKPHIYLHDFQTGRHESLGGFTDMQFAPRFSYDGKTLIFSLEKSGNSDIFEMELSTQKLRRLTNDRGIDTSPSYSPDGGHIVFNSDRGGSSQLYIMDRRGGNVRRLSYGKGRYSTPVWSPRGDYIAFTKQNRGKFFIGVMRPDGEGERTVADSWLVESPVWSPNGRVLMFTQQASPDQAVQIYSVDLTGYNLKKIRTPGGASDPAWSPVKSVK